MEVDADILCGNGNTRAHLAVRQSEGGRRRKNEDGGRGFWGEFRRKSGRNPKYK